MGFIDELYIGLRILVCNHFFFRVNYSKQSLLTIIYALYIQISSRWEIVLRQQFPRVFYFFCIRTQTLNHPLFSALNACHRKQGVLANC